jgi:glycerol kinase
MDGLSMIHKIFISSTLSALKYVIKKQVKSEDIMTAGVTNQRETIVAWDKTLESQFIMQ